MDFSGRHGRRRPIACPNRDRSRADGYFKRGTRLSEIFFPILTEWQPVISRLAISVRIAIEAAAHGQASGLDFSSALLSRGIVRDRDLPEAVAEELGLSVVKEIDPQRLVISDDHAAT